MDAIVLSYTVDELVPYIDWTYFFHAWGIRPSQQHTGFAESLLRDARDILSVLTREVKTHGIIRLCRANAQGDDLIVEDTRIPLLRQQTHRDKGEHLYLCLSDFVQPLSAGKTDTVGLFATSVNLPVGTTTDDPYHSLMIQTLSDRLAEATAEKMHQYVRRDLWGYAAQEHLCIDDLLKCRYQGIRPAIGYPCLPDQSIIFLIADLLPIERIGITLTENGAMQPHASICGLMLSHPAARYFAVGTVGEDQLSDYAKRRGMPIDKTRKFLRSNLT